MSADLDARERLGVAMTLLVLDAVMETRHQPVQLRDVERFLFSAISSAIAAGELKPATFLGYDPPNLFAHMQQLRQCDFVERRPEGYAITQAGRLQAEDWQNALFSPSTVERLRNGVGAAA